MKTLFILPGLNTTKISVLNWDFNLIEEVETNSPQEENIKTFELLEKIQLEEISKIAICNGPWKFTSLRNFTILVNTLKNQFPKIQLFQIPTHKFFQAKSPDSVVFFQLNWTEVFVFEDLEERLEEVKNLKSDKKTWIWNFRNKMQLPQNLEENLNPKKDSEIFWSFFTEEFEVEKIVPFYGK